MHHYPPHTDPQHGALADRIIEKVMKHAAFDGWGAESLRHAIDELQQQDKNIDGDLAYALFPDVPKSLLIWAGRYGDSIMISEADKNKPQGITAMVHHALMCRYRLFQHQREAIRRAMVVLIQPAHIITASQLTWRTADVIWRWAGDTSNDFNYYSKRSLLAGIIAATLPVYVADKTDDLATTEQFLRRRLDDIKTINQAKNKWQSFGDRIFGGKKKSPAH